MKEWGECLNTEQNTPHHCYNVGRHIIEVVRSIPEGNNRLKLAAFFHDIGKPLSKTTDETGRDHFKMHNVLGVEVAADIMRRLKFDNNTIKYVTTMVQYHDARPGNNERAARRLLAKIGKENAEDFITLQMADVLAQSDYMRDEKLSNIRDLEKSFRVIIEREDALTVKDLKINGGDLISMGVKPGPLMGQILNALLEEVVKIPSLNDRTVLIEMVQEFLEEMREDDE
jgi:tRNA nucleotidyltransferase (CCA-adding enzyme)